MMKKCFSLPFLLLLCGAVAAQDYQPLLLDSFYRYAEQPTFGGTVITEDYRGFDYDSNNRLIEARHPESRFRYAYAPDTVFLSSEQKQEDGSWAPFSRRTEVYDDELLVSQRTEFFNNGNYVNGSLRSFFYAPPDLDTLSLLQHWQEGEWINFYKRETTFDDNGYPLEVAEYYVDENGLYDYNRGRLFQHNENGQITQQINIISTITGDHYTARLNWSYDSEGKLDTLRRCHYEGGNDNCVNQGMDIFEYYGQDSITEYRYYWTSNAWLHYGKELTYPGPGIYSARPDSVIFYDYLLADDLYRQRIREYFQYQELPEGGVYFRGEEYTFNLQTADWELAELTEEWYNAPVPVVAEEQHEPAARPFSFFPNPCRPGQQLSIKNLPPKSSKPELLIFDMQGRLYARRPLYNDAFFRAPGQKGVYNILIRSEGRILGTFRQVVQ